MSNTSYTIPAFVTDAKAILEGSGALQDKKALIGERLADLSKRDDLTRTALPMGPSDASTANFLLWREPPYTALVLGQFDPGYLSPVHEHGAHWVIACGYRGEDRWDMYERRDAGEREGHADVQLVDQWSITPGTVVHMPAPPRAIHSHNNVTAGLTQELIFSMVPPLQPEDRAIYDVEDGRCWPSAFNLGGLLVGDHYPPHGSLRPRTATRL